MSLQKLDLYPHLTGVILCASWLVGSHHLYPTICPSTYSLRHRSKVLYLHFSVEVRLLPSNPSMVQAAQGDGQGGARTSGEHSRVHGFQLHCKAFR